MPRIVPFDKRFDHSGFDCGVPALNNYLKNQASQDVRNHYSVIFAALECSVDRIIGFYTLSNASLSLKQIPVDVQKRLPKYPDIPAVRLGRLAVDKTVQGSGVGKKLLADAIMQSLKSSAWAVMAVDAKDARAFAFYLKHGFIAIDASESSLFVLRSMLMNFLARSCMKGDT
jgi:GNAT superfamily N-acetyltransferase